MAEEGGERRHALHILGRVRGIFRCQPLKNAPQGPLFDKIPCYQTRRQFSPLPSSLRLAGSIFAQHLSGVHRIANDERQPMGKGVPTHLQRVGESGELPAGHSSIFDHPGEVRGHLPQRLRRPGGKRQKIDRERRTGIWRCASFFDHHVSVRSAHAKGTDRTQTLPPDWRWPGATLFVDIERTLVPGHKGILLLAMERSWNHSMLHPFDQRNNADQAGSREGMAEVALG